MSILQELQKSSAEFSELLQKYRTGDITPEEKLVLLNLTTSINRLMNASLTEQDALITKIGQLTAKKADKSQSWTPEDINALEAAKADLQALEDATLDTSDIASLTAHATSLRKQIEDDSAVYKAAQEGVVSLVFNGFTDYLTFIRNTQYLNPYRRNRACDDTFRDLVSVLKDLNGETLSQLKERAEYAKKQLST